MLLTSQQMWYVVRGKPNMPSSATTGVAENNVPLARVTGCSALSGQRVSHCAVCFADIFGVFRLQVITSYARPHCFGILVYPMIRR